MRRLSPFLGALFLAAIGLSAPARAQTSASDKAAADALYDRGKKLMADGKLAEACAKLEESERLDPGVGTLLTLGECFDRVGKPASAWTTFREAAALAKTKGQADRERLAREKVDAIAKRLAYLVITVSAPTEGLSVTRDGQAVGKSAWGVPVPIDPGRHPVEASAPGRKPFTTSADIPDKPGTVTVDIPALPVAAAAPAPVASAAPPASASSAPIASAPAPVTTPPPAGASTTSPLRTVGFVAGAAGLVGLGLGVVVELSAKSKHDDAQNHCAPTCDAGGGTSIKQDADKAATIGTIGLVGGGALLVTGVVLVLVSPSGSSASAVRFAPTVGRDQAMLGLTGAF